MGGRTVLLAILVAMVVAVIVPRSPPFLPQGFIQTTPSLAVASREVTFREWRMCVADGACKFMPQHLPGIDADRYPVTGVNWLDVQDYLVWAREHTGQVVRLPTLAEWYAFSGVPPFRPKLIFTDPRLAWAATYGTEGKVDPRLRPSGGFGAAPNGIADVRGNVWEWTSTCAAIGFESAPARCPAFKVAGEHEATVSVFIRDPASGGCASGTPPAHLGFRVVVERE